MDHQNVWCKGICGTYNKKGNREMEKIRTRYAPSPTGKMHVGNLRSALYEFLIAKHAGRFYAAH